jgi:hypothetical protein
MTTVGVLDTSKESAFARPEGMLMSTTSASTPASASSLFRSGPNERQGRQCGEVK